MNWLVEDVPERLECHAMIRYRHTPAKAIAEVVGDDQLQVTFEEPQFGVAPGQAVVLYDDTRVLGGAWIARSSGGS